MLKKAFLIFLLMGARLACAEPADIDTDLQSAMQAYQVPVVGYAIIDHYKVVAVKTISIDPEIKVTQNSLFQAASISKSVSAYAALILVQNKKLNLDQPVNESLTSWKIKDNAYTQGHPVTLRQILSMTSGLSVSGYPGHPQGQSLPSLKQILNGEAPANTAAVQVFYQPGSRYFYSGGSYEVLEQLITDVAQENFVDFVQANVLTPLKMNNSIFQYPLSAKLAATAVPAFSYDGSRIAGGWNNYAIAASGGLWSTPADLAKFAINVSDAYLGNGKGLINQALARQMLTRQANSDFGFGVVVSGAGKNLNFRKNGHNLGYHSEMIMFPNTGQGLVIMTNSENGMSVIDYIMPIIAYQYRWPCYFPDLDELVVVPGFACRA